MKKLFGVAVAGLLAVPAVASAQGIGVEAAGIYATLSGDDFTGTNAGMGLDGQLRFNSGMLSFGGGVQLTSHGIDNISDKLTVMGFFFEPRYHISVPASPVMPFVGARLGYLRESITTGGSDFKASGWLIGASGGVMFRAAPTINIMLAMVFAKASFGNIDQDGVEQPGSEASGTSLALRAGISIKLGR